MKMKRHKELVGVGHRIPPYDEEERIDDEQGRTRLFRQILCTRAQSKNVLRGTVGITISEDPSSIWFSL